MTDDHENTEVNVEGAETEEAEESKPPVLERWDDISILDVPDDAVTKDGTLIWDIIRAGTKLAKDDMQKLQSKHVDNKGRPAPLFMVGIGNFTFIIREVTTKLHRDIIKGCHDDEELMIKAATAELDEDSEEEVRVSEEDRQLFEQNNTIKVALVWPPIGSGDDEFDPEDEDLPFLISAGLFTKILEASGAYDIPMLKKV